MLFLENNRLTYRRSKQFIGSALLFLLCAQFCLCNRIQKVGRVDDLNRFIRDKKNRLTIQQVSNEILMEVAYLPKDLLVAESFGKTETPDSIALKNTSSNFEEIIFFQLRISKNNDEALKQIKEFDDYSEILQIMSFRMAEYVNISTECNKVIPLSTYIFDQTYGLGTSNNLLLGFERSLIDNCKKFSINIAEFGFQTGTMHFLFSTSDLKSVPILEFR